MLEIPTEAVAAQQIAAVSDIEAATAAIAIEKSLAQTPLASLRGLARICSTSTYSVVEVTLRRFE